METVEERRIITAIEAIERKAGKKVSSIKLTRNADGNLIEVVTYFGPVRGRARWEQKE